jgi:hypothetical protein
MFDPIAIAAVFNASLPSADPVMAPFPAMPAPFMLWE